MKRVVKALVEELGRHHSFASKAQAAAINKTEASRKKLEARGGGGGSDFGQASEYTPKPFDPKVIDGYRLSEIREKDVSEVVDYLKHQRQYKELMERYAPMPEEGLDRVHATARRVGLDASKL